MKTAANVTIGDRESPLEADSQTDVVRTGDLIGDRCEISPYAGGGLVKSVGKAAKISGVIKRLGQAVGYEIEIDHKPVLVPMKDVFVGRQVLEDIQAPSLYSRAIREALSHWGTQRDYWGPDTSGLECLCFELASIAPCAHIVVSDNGWQFLIPEPLGGRVVVDCAVRVHGNIWTMTVAVYPDREPTPPAKAIKDHWGRVFTWTHAIASQFKKAAWSQAVRNLELRARITSGLLRPMLDGCLTKTLEKRAEMFGDAPTVYDGGVSIGLSKVRLLPMTVGLTEQPSDRRPYTVISISPDACKKRKDIGHVILHECIHLATAVRGGNPHNGEFHKLADALGLPEKHQH